MHLLKLILSCTVFSCTAIGVMAQGNGMYAGTIPNCVARWTFDNNASLIVDSSGNNNHGTLSNTISNAGWRNAANEAVKFNGSSSGGLVPHSASLSPQNGMTIIGLIKFDAFNSQSCQGSNLISKGPDQATGTYFLRSSDNVYDGSCNITSLDKNALECLFHTDNSTHVNHPFIDAGKWYFVANTFDQGNSKKMVYQIEMDENNYNSPLVTVCDEQPTQPVMLGSNTNDVSIGYAAYNNDPHKFWFNGLMDELVIFDRPLNKKEIMDAYTFLWNKNQAPTAIKEVNRLEKEIRYYVKDHQLYLSGKANEQYSILITDVLGHKVHQAEMQAGIKIVNLAHLARQLFIVNVYNQKGRYTFKVAN